MPKTLVGKIPEPNPSGLCQCGCGQKSPIALQSSTRHGWIIGKSMRYLRGHQNRGKRLRQGPDYLVTPETGCWEWQHARDMHGYGYVYDNGRGKGAHRVYYERYKGLVPDGLVVHHECRNPSCVNPEHLEAVTHAENIRWGKDQKVTEEEVREIRATLGKDFLQRAESLDIHPRSLLRIIVGERWHGV